LLEVQGMNLERYASWRFAGTLWWRPQSVDGDRIVYRVNGSADQLRRSWPGQVAGDARGQAPAQQPSPTPQPVAAPEPQAQLRFRWLSSLYRRNDGVVHGDTRRWVLAGWDRPAVRVCLLLHPILTPFLVALLLAYLFDPLVDRLEKPACRGPWAWCGVCAVHPDLHRAAAGAGADAGQAVVPLYELAPQMLDWLQHTACRGRRKLGLADGFWKFDKVKAAISEHMGQTTDIVGVVLSQATASSLALIGWLANLVLIPVVEFYLLRDWDLMMAKIRSLLPRDREERMVSLAVNAMRCWGRSCVASCW
jgi:hypothetical protein